MLNPFLKGGFWGEAKDFLAFGDIGKCDGNIARWRGLKVNFSFFAKGGF